MAAHFSSSTVREIEGTEPKKGPQAKAKLSAAKLEHKNCNEGDGERRQ